jgi:RND superfamily putative drug exporter
LRSPCPSEGIRRKGPTPEPAPLPAGLDERLPHLAVEPGEDTSREEEAAAAAGGASVVHGFVRTPDGDPVADATVTLLTRGGRRLDRVICLAGGSYIVSVPAPGTYLLAAAAPSRPSRTAHVTVTDGPLVHDVELAEHEVDPVNRPGTLRRRASCRGRAAPRSAPAGSP